MNQQVPSVPAPVVTWWVGGLAIGILLTVATLLVKPIGVSTQYAVLDGVLLHQVVPEAAAENVYLSGVARDWTLLTYGFMFVLGLPIGAFVAALATGRLSSRSVPALWAARFGPSRGKRFAWAFVGGFLLLFGARFGGGCTSGHMISGVSQLALSSLLFSAALFASGIVTARWMYGGRGE